MKIVADANIPFLEGVFEPYAEVVYKDGREIRREDCRILVNGKELPKDGDHVQYTFKANETAQIEIVL